MPCENNREALIEAAAANSELSRELRFHLDVCPSCRATFTEELQLFAAVDAGVRATASFEVPTSLLPRVRVELNKRPLPQRPWIPAAAALAAVAALVLAIVFVRGFGRGAAETGPQMIAVAHSELPAVIQPSTQTATPIETKSSPAKIRPVLPIRIATAAKIEEVAVLIPAGQKRTIDTLLANVRQGKLEAAVVFVEQPEKNLHDLQIAPLDISPIEMKPLANVSAESPASQNEKTSR